MASKKYAAVNQNDCVACGTCVTVCPKSAIKIVKGCYARIDSELCVGCAKCRKVCPTSCIELMERKGA